MDKEKRRASYTAVLITSDCNGPSSEEDRLGVCWGFKGAKEYLEDQPTKWFKGKVCFKGRLMVVLKTLRKTPYDKLDRTWIGAISLF